MFHTGLLPAIRGIYRNDLEVSDIDVWDRVRVPYPIRQIDLHGVLLSHGHLDHSGHISFLRKETPIVSSLKGGLFWVRQVTRFSHLFQQSQKDIRQLSP